MFLIADLSMPLVRRLVPLVMAVIVLAVTVEMIRRRKLREEYAMLWLFTSLALVLLAIFPNVVIWLQDTLQVNYLTIVVLALFLFLSMIVMHFAVVISKQAEDIRQLAQGMALLNQKLQERGSPAQGRSSGPAQDSQTPDDGETPSE